MNEQILSLIPLAKEGKRFDMFHLGRSALVLHYGFQLSTRDVDIVGMQNRELELRPDPVVVQGLKPLPNSMT